MFKGLGQMANLFKQAQEIGGKMQQLKEEMANWRVQGAAGGGLVEVEINGLGAATSVKIDPSLMSGGDQELLESLLAGAITQANDRLKERQAREMSEITGGMDMGALGNMLG
ncbi:MAG: YbaB/EbfC family nucleoid-associated protein [Planctomycetales bacterium]|nr:YbaB/EbfC family nucleoid-associated protein [Planctomycetales bacterium]